MTIYFILSDILYDYIFFKNTLKDALLIDKSIRGHC